MLNIVKHLFREAVGDSRYVVIDSSLSLRMTMRESELQGRCR